MSDDLFATPGTAKDIYAVRRAAMPASVQRFFALIVSVEDRTQPAPVFDFDEIEQDVISQTLGISFGGVTRGLLKAYEDDGPNDFLQYWREGLSNDDKRSLAIYWYVWCGETAVRESLAYNRISADDLTNYGFRIPTGFTPPARPAEADGAKVVCEHPVTKKPILLPPNYDMNEHAIIAFDGKRALTVCNGVLYPLRTGVDVATSEQSVEIAWGTSAQPLMGRRFLPRERLADSRKLVRELAAWGCPVSDKHATSVGALLTDLLVKNRDHIPHDVTTNTLGLLTNDVLMLPTGSISSDPNATPIHYTSNAAATSSDVEPYREAIRAALTWDAPAFWLVLALSVASPVIARYKLRRNPVLYLGGESGYGKTTVAHFATSVYGDPEQKPLLVLAQRTTTAGYHQNFEALHSLPMLIDEAHTVSAKTIEAFEGMIYAFANGTSYTRGGREGTTLGGAHLRGTLLLAGEDVVRFRNTGSQKRMLWIDCAQWKPLGASPYSEEGAKRAALLEAAWKAASGAFATHVLEPIWRDWATFEAAVREAEDDPLIKNINSAWRTPLAIALATVNHLLRAAGVTREHLPDAEAFGQTLLTAWAKMLRDGQRDTDSSKNAWEKLVSMLAEAETLESDIWTMKRFRGSIIACKMKNDPYWRVSPRASPIRAELGESVAKLHGRAWAKAGYITIDEEKNDVTWPKKTSGGTIERVLLVPKGRIEDEDDDQVPEDAVTEGVNSEV